MGVIFFILSIVFLIFFLFLLVFSKSDDGGLSHLSFFGIFIVLILNSIPVFNQVSDIAYLKYADEYIKVRFEALNDVDAQLRGVDVPSALLNADTPYAALVAAKNDLVKGLTKQKMRKLEVKESIYARSLGPSSWVFWFLKPEVTKERELK